MSAEHKRLHLPDCPVIHPHSMGCDCGRPRHPLPYNKALVRRSIRGQDRVRLLVIPKSRLRRRERDLNESRWQVVG